MPIYGYACTECKETWEEDRKMKDCLIPTNKKCPKCGAKKGSVYRHFDSAPTCGVEFGHRGVSKKHNNGGFQDVIHRMTESPGIKGTPEAKVLKDKHLN